MRDRQIEKDIHSFEASELSYQRSVNNHISSLNIKITFFLKSAEVSRSIGPE
jgi:hypothetical protein